MSGSLGEESGDPACIGQVDSQKEYAGVLKAYDNRYGHNRETEDDTERTFQRSDISLIRLAFDF